jgi:hypothetical protein
MDAQAGLGGEAANPRRSSYGRDYWLRRCEGFLVVTETKRIGRVAGVRYGERTNEPEVLEVRAGLFGRSVLLVSVQEVADVIPTYGRVVLNDPPRLPG